MANDLLGQKLLAMADVDGLGYRSRDTLREAAAALKTAEAEEINADEQICALIKEKAAYNRALVKANARITELEKTLREITREGHGK